MRLDDDRPLPERIRADARFHQIDLSKYVTIQEAARIMGVTTQTVRDRFDWLCGITICGRKFVKKDRTEWLDRFRKGQLTSDDQMGESLAPYDVKAQIAENERNKQEEEERKREEAEANRQHGFVVDPFGEIWIDYDNNDTWVTGRQAALNLDRDIKYVRHLAWRGKIRRRNADRTTWQPVESSSSAQLRIENCQLSIGNSPNSARGGLQGTRAMYSLRDIEAYIEKRDNRGRKRSVSFNDPDRPFTPVREYPMDRSAHENHIITRQDAARILGCTTKNVTNLVTRGKLKCYSERPGRQGVTVWFSAPEVERYAKSEQRVKHRAAWDKVDQAKKKGTYQKTYKKPYQFEFGEPYLYTGNKWLSKDFGEYYTIRQAAQILGISTSAVRHKIKKGYLPAVRKNRALHGPNDKWNDRRWWFIKKEDLHSYKAGREYRKRHKAFIEARHRKLFGDSLTPDGLNARTPERLTARTPDPGPVTPGEDHYIPHDPRNVAFLRGEQARSKFDQYLRWKKSEANRIPEEPVTPGEDHYIPHDPRNAVFLKTEHQRWLEEIRAHLEELNSWNDDRRHEGSYPPRYFFPGHHLPKDDDS